MADKPEMETQSTFARLLNCIISLVRYPKTVNMDDLNEFSDTLMEIRPLLTPYPTSTAQCVETAEKIFELVKSNCEANYGISVIDVSILRISYPDANLQAIFANISAERQGVIDKILADAEAQVSDITTSADAEAEKIKGEGITKAAEIRAKAEKEVASIYANAQSANIELYKFLKELDTIVNSVNEGTVLVVDADSYPFNILLGYGSTVENGSDEKVVEDLTYIIATLRSEGKTKEADDLVAAINAILVAYSKGEG